MEYNTSVGSNWFESSVPKIIPEQHFNHILPLAQPNADRLKKEANESYYDYTKFDLIVITGTVEANQVFSHSGSISYNDCKLLINRNPLMNPNFKYSKIQINYDLNVVGSGIDKLKKGSLIQMLFTKDMIFLGFPISKDLHLILLKNDKTLDKKAVDN